METRNSTREKLSAEVVVDGRKFRKRTQPCRVGGGKKENERGTTTGNAPTARGRNNRSETRNGLNLQYQMRRVMGRGQAHWEKENTSRKDRQRGFSECPRVNVRDVVGKGYSPFLEEREQKKQKGGREK